MRTKKLEKAMSWGKWLLAGTTVLVMAETSTAFSGGTFYASGSYVGPMGTNAFAFDPCQTAPVMLNEDPTFGVREWSFNVSAVRDDGDPNTFVRCRHRDFDGVEHRTSCVAGLSDGTVMYCNRPDALSMRELPEDGDILYMLFVIEPNGTVEECALNITRSWGEPDPKCRAGGGDGDGDGDTAQPQFPCDSSNSTPFADNVIASATVDKCYSFSKATGELRMSTWQGQSFVVSVGDSQGHVFPGVNIGNGSWATILGVADGPVYFYLSSISSGSSIPMQVHDW